MSRNWIVVGDKTNHGGIVTTGSPFTDVDGYPMARVDDKVSCPQCGPTTIATGDPTRIIDGKPMARHGDKTACGATLISGKQFRGFTEEGSAVGGMGASSPGISDASRSAVMLSENEPAASLGDRLALAETAPEEQEQQPDD